MKEKISITEVYREGFSLLSSNLQFFLIALIPVIAQLFVGNLSAGLVQATNNLILSATTSADVTGALLAALPGLLVSSLIAGLVTLIAVSFAEAAYLLATRELLKKKKLDIKAVLNLAVSKIVKIIVISLIIGIAVGFGFVLLIVPGIILMLLLAYAVPLAVLEDKGIMESIKGSIEIGKKNMGDTFMFALISIVIITVFNYVTGLLPAPAPQMLSALVLTPFISISFGVFYLKWVKQ